MPYMKKAMKIPRNVEMAFLIDDDAKVFNKNPPKIAVKKLNMYRV